MRRALAVISLLAFLPRGGEGQIPDLPTLGRNWTDFSYPKVFYTLRNKFAFGLYYAQIRPLDFKDFYAPQPYRASIAINIDVATSGSFFVGLDAHLPALVDGWRFTGELSASRRARDWYFGIGNDKEFDKAKINDAQPHFYQWDDHSYLFRGEAQRRIVGKLRLLLGVHVERWRIDTLSGPSKLAEDARQPGTRIGRNTADIAVRLGLVFDTRDDEVAPRRGVTLEAIYTIADSAIGNLSYTRATVSAAGYLPVSGKITVTGRAVVQAMGGAPVIGSLDMIEHNERPYVGIGGKLSHRGSVERRFLGEDKLLFNADIRWEAYTVPTLFRATLFGFVDAGRVFTADDLRLTTQDLHWAGGAGLLLQLFRAAIAGASFGVGGDGVALHFYTKWSY